MFYYLVRRRSTACFTGWPALSGELAVGPDPKVAGAGVLVGLTAAFLTTRLIASLLFGIGAADAPTFVGVGGLLTLAALVACLLPAARLAAVAPATVLRGD